MKSSKISIFLIGLSLGAVSVHSMAATTCTNTIDGVPGKGTVIIEVPGYSTPEFNPFVPNGTVIDSRVLDLTGSDAIATCTPNVGNVFDGQLGKTSDPIYHTYSTSVPGIGLRLRYKDAAEWWPVEFNLDYLKEVRLTPKPIEIEFVKTGPITAQATITGEIGGVWLDYKRFQMASFKIKGGGIIVRPRVPTCSVATKQVTVSMSPTGSISSRDFSGVGSTSAERSFNITLNCSGGDVNTSTNAYVTLTDQTSKSNRTNQLSLTSNSTAKGVKVQILKDGKLLSYGPDSNASGNPNQWKAGNIPRGVSSFDIPLTARYVQSESTIKGGTADAVATFTMSYQ